MKLVLDYLKLHRIFHWRNNTGAMFGSYKGKKWAVRFGKPGAPDIFAITPDPHGGGTLFGIEVKGLNGRQSEAQKQYQVDFELAGGEYILARSLEDVTSVLI